MNSDFFSKSMLVLTIVIDLKIEKKRAWKPTH